MWPAASCEDAWAGRVLVPKAEVGHEGRRLQTGRVGWGGCPHPAPLRLHLCASWPELRPAPHPWRFGDPGRENLPERLPRRARPSGLSGRGWCGRKAVPLQSESPGQAVSHPPRTPPEPSWKQCTPCFPEAGPRPSAVAAHLQALPQRVLLAGDPQGQVAVPWGQLAVPVTGTARPWGRARWTHPPFPWHRPRAVLGMGASQHFGGGARW